MKQNFKLNINNPCPKKFENFEATQNGGFCASCQTEVIDFTKMSEDEIKEYFKNPSKNVCGRFHDSQLKTYSNDKKKQKSKLSFALLGASVLSLFVTNSIQAQKKVNKIEISENNEKKVFDKIDTNSYTIKGIVVEKGSNEPLIGVSIYSQEKITTGILSDVNGSFSFPQALKNGDVIMCSYVGYETQKIAITTKNYQNLKIELRPTELEEVVVVGERIQEKCTIGVVVIRPQKKPSLWQRFKNIFRRKSKKT